MKIDRFLKTFLSTLLALVVISILTFLLTKLSAADPAENYLRASSIRITPKSLANARHYLGLDQSWFSQYLSWASRVLQGDFGISYLRKVPALPLVLGGFFSTLSLAMVSFVLFLMLALPLGLISGLFPNSIWDRFIRFFAFSSVSVPSFWLGYLLMLLFGVRLKWLPISGSSTFSSLILPSLTLSLPLVGQYVILIRKEIHFQSTRLFVENAKMRGVKLSYIIWNHLLRNSLPALATGMSLTVTYLLTGSVIVEEVFSWQGIGSVFIKALQSSDIPVIQACMFLFGLLFFMTNSLIQIMTNWIDPRLRKRRLFDA